MRALVLAEQHVAVVDRVFGKWFVHEQLEIRISAHRRDEMLRGAEPTDALKDEMGAVG
jgi:hypothetical protein